MERKRLVGRCPAGGRLRGRGLLLAKRLFIRRISKPYDEIGIVARDLAVDGPKLELLDAPLPRLADRDHL